MLLGLPAASVRKLKESLAFSAYKNMLAQILRFKVC